MRGGILLKTALGMAALLALAACGGSDEGGGSLNQGGQDPNAPVNTDPGTTSGGSSTPVKTPAQEQEEEVKKILDARKVDYGEALRTASLKLVSELPTFDQIQRLATASNEAAQKQVYEQEIRALRSA
jgi:ABC-type glycerol-3-phosphate transport system substrate-binding protein